MQKETLEEERFDCFWGDDNVCVSYWGITIKEAYRSMITYLCQLHEANEFEFMLVSSLNPGRKLKFAGQRVYVFGKYKVAWTSKEYSDGPNNGVLMAGTYEETCPWRARFDDGGLTLDLAPTNGVWCKPRVSC